MREKNVTVVVSKGTPEQVKTKYREREGTGGGGTRNTRQPGRDGKG